MQLLAICDNLFYLVTFCNHLLRLVAFLRPIPPFLVQKKHGVGEGNHFSNPMLRYAKAFVLREFFYVAVR